MVLRQLTVDLKLTDGFTHQVGLYVLDWDNMGRTERVDVVDQANGSVLDSRTVSSFTGGQYLVYNVTGPGSVPDRRRGSRKPCSAGIFDDAPSTSPPQYICENRHIYAGQLGERIWRTGLQSCGWERQPDCRASVVTSDRYSIGFLSGVVGRILPHKLAGRRG